MYKIEVVLSGRSYCYDNVKHHYFDGGFLIIVTDLGKKYFSNNFIETIEFIDVNA